MSGKYLNRWQNCEYAVRARTDRCFYIYTKRQRIGEKEFHANLASKGQGTSKCDHQHLSLRFLQIEASYGGCHMYTWVCHISFPMSRITSLIMRLFQFMQCVKLYKPTVTAGARFWRGWHNPTVMSPDFATNAKQQQKRGKKFRRSHGSNPDAFMGFRHTKIYRTRVQPTTQQICNPDFANQSASKPTTPRHFSCGGVSNYISQQ